jgi:tetratricopeptide (TPR) repeat protein
MESQKMATSTPASAEPSAASVQFFDLAKKFYHCRKTLSDYWNDLHFDNIASSPRYQGVNIIEPEADKFNENSRQQNTTGAVVSNLDELYATAEIANQFYQQFLSGVLTELAIPLQTLKSAPLKGRSRAAEKALDDYSNRIPGPGISWLFDIVRASIECESEADICSIVDFLSRSNNGIDNEFVDHNLSGVAFKLMRLKNRFRVPTAGGFRDMNLNICIRFPVQDRNIDHICELQIHYRPLKEFGKSLHSHDVYSFFRTYFRGNETSVATRLTFLDEIFKQSSEGALSDASGLPELVQAAIDRNDEDKLLSLKSLLELMNENQLCVDIQQALVNKWEAAGQTNTNDYFAAVNNLGAMLLNICDYDGARTMFERALAGYESNPQVGPHSDLALEVVSNLGNVALAVADYQSSLELCNRALKDYETYYGAEHEKTLVVLNNLGILYRRVNQLDKSLELYLRCLAGREKLLGPDHPHTIMVVTNIGVVYYYLGDYENALKYDTRAFEGNERLFGPHHSETLGAKQNMGKYYERQSIFVNLSFCAGMVYQSLNRLEEARECNEQSYEGRMKSLGPSHPSTLSSMISLGAVYEDIGTSEFLQTAVELYEDAAKGFHKLFGDDHPSYLAAVRNLAGILQRLHYFADAITNFTIIYEKRAKLSGPHSGTALNALYSVAGCQLTMGDFANAATSLQTIIDACEQRIAVRADTGDVSAISELAPVCVESCRMLGLNCFHQGLMPESVTNFGAMLAHQLEWYGESHRSTPQVRHLYEIHKEAAELYARRDEIEQQWKASIVHDVHPQHELVRSSFTAAYYYCDACSAYKVGFRYSCKREAEASQDGEAHADHAAACDVDVCISCCGSLLL